MDKTTSEVAILAGGCFWCLEAAYLMLPGVVDVESGYIGGNRENPSYEEVCTGKTGHAEAVRISFDSARTDFKALLDLFWRIHDPTTRDRQGADLGTQYRSAIFWLDGKQKAQAEESIRRAQSGFSDPIVTQLVAAPKFWKAEDYHRRYFELHPEAGYCRAVIAPKLKKAGLGT